MAHTRSARKRARISSKRGQHNKSIRSQCKTHINKANKLVDAGDYASAQEAVRQAISVLDRTVQKGVIHRNNAARHKASLTRKLESTLSASPPSVG